MAPPGMSSGPRVTFIGPVPPHSGGIAQHSARVVEALRSCGAEVTVLSWASQYPRALYKGAARGRWGAPFPGARFLLRWWDPVSWIRAGRIARRGDLLVMPWVTPVHAVPQRVAAGVARVPVALMMHNVLPHERMPLDAALARHSLRRAARVVAHASTVADLVHRLAPGVPTRVVPCPPLLPIAPRPLPPRPPLRLLCLGLVRRYKGFDLAVDAVRVMLARGADVQLTIAGEIWEDEKAWRRRVASPDLGGRVTLIARYQADEEIAALLAAHHVLLAPYRSATQSAVLPLAFAAHRPVVATDVGGLREAVEDGGGGVIVPPEDPERLAAAVIDLARDLEGAAARAAATSWTWEAVARALLGAA